MFIDRGVFFIEETLLNREYRSNWVLMRIEYDTEQHRLVLGFSGYRVADSLEIPSVWSRELIESVVARVRENVSQPPLNVARGEKVCKIDRL